MGYPSRVKQYRERAGLSQEALARHLRVSRQTIVNIERGQNQPRVSLARALSELLGAGIEELFPQGARGMSTYRFVVHPHAYIVPPHGAVAQLDRSTLTRVIVDAVVRDFIVDPTGSYEIEVALSRPTHQEALDDIKAGLEQLGFNVAQALVTEWITAWAEGALLGGTSGGAIGSKNNDLGETLVGLGIGAAVGALLGSMKQSPKMQHIATWYPYGGWGLEQVMPQMRTDGAIV